MTMPTDALAAPSSNVLATVQQESWYQEPLVVLVLGASGDLAKKKTYPALFELWAANLLPKSTTIYGFARTPFTNQQHREHIRPYLMKQRCRGCDKKDAAQEAIVEDFLHFCYYENGSSYRDWQIMFDILVNAQPPVSNLLVYLALPAHVFGESSQALKTALKKLKAQGIDRIGFTRIILEKPFGKSTETCRALLDTLKRQEWEESDLYRIDHYLGKEIVQNIVVLRQHNPWLKAIWNKDVIHCVHIIFKEPFGLEGRSGYFDGYGIVRDILQNHLLQILTLIALDLPQASDKRWMADQIRDAKVNVLKKMSIIQPRDCLLGQYEGYLDDVENKNETTATTPTYACLRAWVNSDSWKGVPFILEAGKALDERLCEARLHFHGSASNALVLRVQPTPSVFFTANMKARGFSERPINTRVGVDYHGALPDAYTKLVLNALRGQQANFVRDDELLEAWKLFTPLLQQQEASGVRPPPYKRGTSGPTHRQEFLQAVMGPGASLLPWSSL